MTPQSLFPGFEYDCGEDNGSSVWTDWVTPGCSESATPAGTVIKDSIFYPLVEDLRNGVGDGVKTMATFWVNVPDPDVGSADTGVASDVVGFLQSSLAPLVGAIMVLAIMWGAGKTIWDYRNGAYEAGRGIVELLFRYIMTAALAVPLIAASMIIAREIGTFILAQSTQGTDFVDNLFAMFSSDAGLTSAIGVAVLLLIGILVAGLQVGVMIARGGALLVLTGTILLAAAATNTETGKQMFKTYVAWFLAFIAYQPAACIVYAGGFRLAGSDTAAAGNSWMQVIYGITIIGLAVLTLPALLRLVAPMTTPVASGRGAGGVMTGAATTVVTMTAVRAAS
jgi:hypothetical protein